MSRKLAAYQLDALPPPEAERVARHLASCAACQAEWRALQRTAEALQPMSLQEAPASVWHNIERQLTEKHNVHRREQRVFWRPAFAAAALLLVVMLTAIWLGGHGSRPDSGETLGYTEWYVATAWDAPFADKAALGLAMLAANEAGWSLENEEAFD